MLLRLTDLRVPSWSARTKLHAPSRPAPCGAGQDMAKRPPSSQKIGRLLQHHQALYPRDLATVSATRRGACACPCVACAGWCVGRGALAASLWHRVSCAVLAFACAWLLAHSVCCLLPLFLLFLRVLWPRCVPSVSSCTLRCLCVSVLVFVAAWCARPPLIGSAHVASVPKARSCAAPCT